MHKVLAALEEFVSRPQRRSPRGKSASIGRSAFGTVRKSVWLFVGLLALIVAVVTATRSTLTGQPQEMRTPIAATGSMNPAQPDQGQESRLLENDGSQQHTNIAVRNGAPGSEDPAELERVQNGPTLFAATDTKQDEFAQDEAVDLSELSMKRLLKPSENEGQAATSRQEPVSYWEMPQSMRDELPDLQITVLVYAEAIEDRFVIIDGNKWLERGQLVPGLVLDEIRRDGAVFWYRNRRFLVQGN